MKNIIPNSEEPLVDAQGKVTPIWYRFLQELLVADSATDAETLDDLRKNLKDAGLVK